MENFDLKRFAHLGDSVYEIFIRENVIFKTKSSKTMHQMTTAFVNANFQAKMAEIIFEDFLNEEEKEIFRRARNLPLTVNKKHSPETHRFATALEVITGYFYLNDKTRLNEMFQIIKKYLITEEKK